MISRSAKANPTLVFVIKNINQSELPIILTAKIYFICPKISSLFLVGTHEFGNA